MEQPLVSVIIPTYNRAEFLREAIKSVLAQTYPHFELLILDNCSPDNTPEVVASFSDPRIKYLRHQCNIGACANWTYGIYWAQGKYLSILGDDDRYRPDFLIHRVAEIEANSSIVSVFGPFETWDGGNELSGPLFFRDIDDLRHSTPLHGMEAMDAVVRAQFVGATLYRTSSVHTVWDKAVIGQKAMDTLLNVLLASENGNNVFLITESDVLYRLHPGQDTAMNTKLIYEDAARAFGYVMRWALDTQIRRLYKEKFFGYMNGLARLHWEAGETTLAARCFVEGLKVSPFHIFAWLRLLRCYIWRLLG